MKQRKLFKSQRAKRGEGRKDKNVPIFVSTEVKSILDTLKKAYSNCHFEGKVNGHVTYNQLFRRLVATVGLAADQDVMKEFKKLSNEKAQLDKTVAPVTAVDVATVAQATDGKDVCESLVKEQVGEAPKDESNNEKPEESNSLTQKQTQDGFYFIKDNEKKLACLGDRAPFYYKNGAYYEGCRELFKNGWELVSPDGRRTSIIEEAWKIRKEYDRQLKKP